MTRSWCPNCPIFQSKNGWLEWKLLTVTLISCPEGVTVADEACTEKPVPACPIFIPSHSIDYYQSSKRRRKKGRKKEGWQEGQGRPLKATTAVAFMAYQSGHICSHPRRLPDRGLHMWDRQAGKYLCSIAWISYLVWFSLVQPAYWPKKQTTVAGVVSNYKWHSAFPAKFMSVKILLIYT